MRISFFLFFVLVFSGRVYAQKQVTKHALIFAIGNYPKSGGWDSIASVNDVPYIKAALERQSFKSENIKTVLNAEATKEGIRNAIESLIKKVRKDDVVVIHFSSHGEQVADNGSDETDGFDETIVSYDAVSPKISKDFQRDQANYFRDDEFDTLINRLRKNLGKEGDVVVFMDACHSGTGIRGVAKVRGGVEPFVYPGFDKSKFSAGDPTELFNENKTDDAGRATYVVISAARAEELNFETKDDKGKPIGSLTYAISKAFENLEEETSYRSLFAKILVTMNTRAQRQNPVLEGTGIDRSLFGGKFNAQKPYVEISRIKGNIITVKAGLFAGLDAGARIELHPSGENPSKEKLLATGTVTQSGNYTAEIKLDKSPGITLPAQGWVYVTAPVFKVAPIVIGVVTSADRGSAASPSFSEADANKIKTGLKNFPIVKFKNINAELFLIKGEGIDSIRIASNGYLYSLCSASDLEGLKDTILRYARYKLLQNEIKNADFDFEVKLVPVVNGKPDTSLISTKRAKDGIYEFTVEDTLALWVKNNGRRPVYFNILDLQPDGVINAILPDDNVAASELRIREGVSDIDFKGYRLHVFPPYGLEIFKIFVSFDEINMRTIADTRGVSSRGNLNSFEAFVKNSFNTRGTGGSIQKSEGMAFNIPFRIVEKK